MPLRLNRHLQLFDWPASRSVNLHAVGDDNIVTTPDGIHMISMDDYSLFGLAPANLGVLEGVKAKYSSFANRVAEIKDANARADIGAIALKILLPKNGGLDASLLALLDAAHIEFSLNNEESSVARLLIIDPAHTNDPYYEWGNLGANETKKYLSQAISESFLNTECTCFIIDAIAETISNALHSDGVNNEFCCEYGQGRQWSLVVIARETNDKAEIAFSVVTGGATIPAVMLKRYHSNEWSESTLNVKNFASISNSSAEDVQIVEEAMMNIAVNPNGDARQIDGHRVNGWGNGLKNLRTSLQDIADMHNHNVRGYVISDSCVCDLFPRRNRQLLDIKRLESGTFLSGSLVSASITIQK